MAEPLFIDCLTDAQFWSLFDSGVLQAYLLPGDVLQRLQRLAPAHGSYLFVWPADRPLLPLQKIVPSLHLHEQQPPRQMPRDLLRASAHAEQMRAEIEAFCARDHGDMPPEGGRIYVITLNPHIELRAGPYLEPTPRDLATMSVPELEAYVDAMLRLDNGIAIGTATASPSINRGGYAPPCVGGQA